MTIAAQTFCREMLLPLASLSQKETFNVIIVAISNVSKKRSKFTSEEPS